MILGLTFVSAVFAKHLNALHASRQAFIESDSSMRIKRALRHKIRASQQVFERGDKVFYKREGSVRWSGPATVLFQDGKIVFVRHGMYYYRVSVNRLIKAGNEEWLLEEAENLDENDAILVS